jgi:hypothetical protein
VAMFLLRIFQIFVCMRLLTILLFPFLFSSVVKAQNTAWLIVPGKSIGQVKLEAPAESLQVLGTPDVSDAAMMKAWSVWYSRRKDKSIDSSHVLAVYTAMGTGDSPCVKQIRVNSPQFKTVKGIGAGSTMAAIKKAYPGIKLVKTYESDNKSRRIAVYDDNKAGIAFEISDPRSRQPVCSMVVVYDAGKDVSNYLDYHLGFDSMKILEH